MSTLLSNFKDAQLKNFESNKYLYTAAGLLAILAALWPLFADAVHNHFLRKLTGIVDLDKAALPRKGGKIKGTAVIAGSSWAGLITARILSTHFEKVVMIESEEIPAKGKHRKNVAQFGQLHVLLAFGYRVLKKLFPTQIDKAIKDADGRVTDMESSAPNSWLKGGFIKTVPSELPQTLVLSRFSYEPMFRKLVMDNVKNLRCITASVTGLELSTDRSKVVGVTYRKKDGAEDQLAADFVVDATGPSCGGMSWLKKLSLPVPQKVFYNPYITYITVVFPSNEKTRAIEWPNNAYWNKFDGVTLYAAAADPYIGKNYGVYWQHVENGGILVCVLGYGKQPPFKIDTLEEFVDVAAKDFPPFKEYGREMIAEAKRQGKELQMPKVYLPQCYRVDYAAVASQLPQNFVVLGDARLRVNPTYGQGMSKSMLDAVTLDSVLREHNHLDVATRYFKKQAARADGLYDFTKFEDYGMPSTDPTVGETLKTGWFNRFYVSNLISAAHKNPVIGTIFYNVSYLVWPSTALFSPTVVFAVMKEALLG